MTAYTFETITAEQALAFDATTDSLTIPGSSTEESWFNPERHIRAWFDGTTLTLSNSTRSVTFGPGIQGEHITYAVTGEFWIGSAGSDSIASLGANNKIWGGTGDDTLTGGTGDTMWGGDGDDVVDFSSGPASVDGGDGTDVLRFSNAHSGVMISAAGGITFTGVAAASTLARSFEVVEGTAFDDYINGLTTGDRLYGFGGDDRLMGGAGDDTLVGGAGADWLQGGDGNDVLVGDLGGGTLQGGAGNDEIFSGPGLDNLSGGEGDDTLHFHTGDARPVGTQFETISEWQINERLAFEGVTGLYAEGAAASVDAASALASEMFAGGIRFAAISVSSRVYLFVDSAGDGGTAEDVLAIIGGSLAKISADNIVGTAASLSGITAGTPGNDTLVGTAFGDSINAGAGDDLVFATTGTDILDGGVGSDTLSYANATGPIGLDLYYISPKTVGPLMVHAVSSFEAVVGSSFNDTIWGNPSAQELLSGAAGDDTLKGQSGDRLFGDQGNDSLTATNAARLEGGSGDDTLSDGGLGQLYGGDGADSLSAPNGALFGEAGDDTLAGARDVDGLGYSVASTNAVSLSGGAGSDRLMGGGGVDTLVGGDGADTISGGRGADDITLGGGADRILIGLGDSVSATNDFDVLRDWSPADQIQFANNAANGFGYLEATAADRAAARALAQSAIVSGAYNYVAVSIGSDVIVFADSASSAGSPNGGVADAVVLQGASLADVAGWNFGVTGPTGPKLSATLGQQGYITGNMDLAHIGNLTGDAILEATPTKLHLSGTDSQLTLVGSGFTYDLQAQLTDGLANGVAFNDHAFGASVWFSNASAAPFAMWVAMDATQVAFATLLAGDDRLRGAAESDLIRGFGGNDLISGGGGRDSVFGGDGDDVIYGSLAPGQSGTISSASTYLRGEAGDDYIVGANGFDDIQGNMGADTESGGFGNDWVVGGKDDDLLYGDAGDDVLNGNLGNDVADGGDGADIVRGGQGDDVLLGRAGNDWLSGDLGDDTLVGGSGADTFHAFSGVGLDFILDFNAAEGDRLRLDPGTNYSLAQVGDDTVVTLAGGQVVLVGVSLSGLNGGWIAVG